MYHKINVYSLLCAGLLVLLYCISCSTPVNLLPFNISPDSFITRAPVSICLPSCPVKKYGVGEENEILQSQLKHIDWIIR